MLEDVKILLSTLRLLLANLRGPTRRTDQVSRISQHPRLINGRASG